VRRASPVTLSKKSNESPIESKIFAGTARISGEGFMNPDPSNRGGGVMQLGDENEVETAARHTMSVTRSAPITQQQRRVRFRALQR